MLFSMLAVPCLKCTLCCTAFGLNCQMHSTGGTRPKNSYPLFDMTLVLGFWSFFVKHTAHGGPDQRTAVLCLTWTWWCSLWSFLWNLQHSEDQTKEQLSFVWHQLGGAHLLVFSVKQAEQERVNAALRRKEEQIKEQLSRERERSDKRDRSPDRKWVTALTACLPEQFLSMPWFWLHGTASPP